MSSTRLIDSYHKDRQQSYLVDKDHIIVFKKKSLLNRFNRHLYVCSIFIYVIVDDMMRNILNSYFLYNF